MGPKGIGSALRTRKDQHSAGMGGMAVKVMTDSKQQNSNALGRKWRKLEPTAVLASVEWKAAVAVEAGVLSVSSTFLSQLFGI